LVLDKTSPHLNASLTSLSLIDLDILLKIPILNSVSFS
jgi:hypothetical protein